MTPKQGAYTSSFLWRGIDHRNGIVRLVGFWKERWHDMKYDEHHPGKWIEANN